MGWESALRGHITSYHPSKEGAKHPKREVPFELTPQQGYLLKNPEGPTSGPGTAGRQATEPVAEPLLEVLCKRAVRETELSLKNKPTGFGGRETGFFPIIAEKRLRKDPTPGQGKGSTRGHTKFIALKAKGRNGITYGC